MNLKNLKKYLIQSLIYLLEILIVMIIFNCILSYFFPIENSFEYISRSLGIYAAYQLFVYSTLKLANDAQKDAYSTLKTMNEEALLIIKYYKDDNETYFYSSSILKNHINFQLDDSVFNMDEVKKQYRQLIKNIDNKNAFSIEQSIIGVNHYLTLLNQEFLLSFLLRVIKRPSPQYIEQYLYRHNREENND